MSAGICPQFLSSGACSNLSICPYRHDIKICDICSVVCTSESAYRSHLAGKRHRASVQGSLTWVHCPICRENVRGLNTWPLHIASPVHQAKALLQGIYPFIQPEEAVVRPGHVYCNLCKRDIVQVHWNRHLDTQRHRKKELFTSFKSVMDDAIQDKHGVSVSPGDEGLDFGIIEDASRGVSADLTVRNTVPTSRIVIVDVQLSSKTSRGGASAFTVPDSVTQRPLVYGRDLSLTVLFTSAYRGHFDDRLEIVFEDTVLRQRFVIVRLVRGIVGSATDYEALKPTSPYVPRKRSAREQEVNVVAGPPPSAISGIRYVVELPHAHIPRALNDILSTGSVADVISQVRATVLPNEFNVVSHGRYMKNLVWIEEHKMERDLEMYDLVNVTLERYNQYYYLKVPGLAEKRPSVLVGDRILVQAYGASKGHWFEGHVHVLRQAEVGLRFHQSFTGHTSTRLYNVHFKLNRHPLRRQHQALHTAFISDRLLFPRQAHLTIGASMPSIFSRSSFRPHNPVIGTNPCQRQAVISITSQKPGSVPFVVFGPPGTGKTVTIVEAIRQLLKSNADARILACAPSNSAADLIASRLIDLGTEVLFRFYAPSRFKNQVPDNLLPFTYSGDSDDRHFSIPLIPRVKRFRVVISTCVSASFAHGIGLPRGHFSHIFVDEAGQATEPEVMIAVKTMADNDTNVILSGDPKQLGPIIRSPVARGLGLEKSYMERLMMLDEIYDSTVGHGVSVVKLVMNFRSHNAILRFPNERFYRGELEPHGNPSVINFFLDSPHLVNKKFPIVFHGIRGKDDREASSPSFFNIDEVTQVKSYVQTLKAAGRPYRITDNDIGVITPYHAQHLKIKAVLRPIAEGIKVGSVEEFQGQERKVIIISTVRSSREFVEYDLKHTLGFVANPRRFNVAVTRAQALLIIVGDPTVLALDPLWRQFLNYIYVNGGWKGQDISWDPRIPVRESGGYDQQMQEAGFDDMNDFSRRMEALTLRGADGQDDEEDANVDRPWREVE